jgi:glycosyltransferase involved in cell wall biosynthesis
MGVRHLGHKVIYQPASRLLHYEGATAGTDIRSGLKRYQVTNYEKFRDKWQATLEKDHCPDDPSNPFQASDKRGTSILVIDDRLPTPDRDAGSARMAEILRAIALRYRPVFAPTSTDVLPRYEEELWKIGVETTTGTEYMRLARKRDFSVAIVSRPDVAEAVIPTLRRNFPRLRLIFDLVDVHFIRLQREYELTEDVQIAEQAKRYKQIESRLARMADMIWCNSADDERVMNELAPRVPSVVIPTIHSITEHVNGFEEREGLLFVGNMNHRPNLDSLKYLVTEVMPLVRAKLPGIKLYVAGSGTPDLASFASEDTLILGHVPDLDALLASCRLMAAPIRFGAGVKGKIGESLAHGLPVVTTSIGAESMGIRSEVEAMIADTEQSFADAIIRAYNDRQLWESMSRKGQELIKVQYSPAVIDVLITGSIRRLTDAKA